MDRYLFVTATLILTVYAQLIVKSRALRHVQVEAGVSDGNVLRPLVPQSFASGVLASITPERRPVAEAVRR